MPFSFETLATSLDRSSVFEVLVFGGQYTCLQKIDLLTWVFVPVYRGKSQAAGRLLRVELGGWR